MRLEPHTRESETLNLALLKGESQQSQHEGPDATDAALIKLPNLDTRSTVSNCPTRALFALTPFSLVSPLISVQHLCIIATIQIAHTHVFDQAMA